MKMKNNFFVLLALFAIYAITSCEDLVEKDLEKQWVYALSPQDFASVNSQTPVLAWEKVKGAISYNLKLYKTTSDYNTVTTLIVDTNVTGTQYTQALKTGYYKWDIYAQNGSSRSGLSIFRFQVDSSSDITNQHVVLISPLNNTITDTVKQNLVWSPVVSATQYNVQVYEFNSGKLGDLYKGAIVDKSITSFLCEFPSIKKTYKWRVNALNGILSSPVSEYTLTIDTTKLGIPVIISPKDTTSVHGNPVIFQWNPVATATKYKMEVVDDTTKTVADTTAFIDAGKPLSQSYYGTKLSKKTYWRVKAIKVNTEGTFSQWWLFKRNL